MHKAINTSPCRRTYVLTTDCPDRIGIVAAVSGYLARNHALITEFQNFDDPVTKRSFIRCAFEANNGQLPDVEELARGFQMSVAHAFRMTFQLVPEYRKTRVLVAVSKLGHCLNSLLHRWRNGLLPVEIVGVVSNHQDLRRLVEWCGLPFHYLPIADGYNTKQERQMIELFQGHQADLLVLARYMQILSATTCEYFQSRAINIHHSFLPSFAGARPYHQAHKRGVKMVGATAHYVTPMLDAGPIIEQGVERVDHAMTPEDLMTIGSELETSVLNRAVQWHAERRVFLNGPRTVVLR